MEWVKKEICSQLINSYPSSVLDEDSKNDEFIVRLTVQDVGEVEDFKNTLSRITKTQWINKRANSDPQRYAFWKTWVCQHSRKNKATNSKRNSKCEARLTILIKKVTRNTKRHDAFLKRSPPLAVKVILSLEHTHSIDAAESLRKLRVLEEVKKTFTDYFSYGMTPSEASMYHENKFLLDSNYEDMANASLNPTKRQVFYLYDCWRNDNSDTYLAYLLPLERLKERIPFYSLNGSTIKIHDDDDEWAVLLVSPIMRRTQSLSSSKEVIFIDSTCNSERTSSTLTVLYTATKAGAIPIATLIHKHQTTDNYFHAFMLLKENFPGCFGGENFPALFMTEDLTAEKTALASVWPQSSQLLCHFYVAQAEWTWLFSKDSNVEAEEIPRLMKLFQNVMYAATEGNLLDAAITLLNENQYPEFLSRFNSFYKRRYEWVLLDRDLTTNNETNNFAESTIRIIKDFVLCRTKAFSVVALIEFCLEVWEKFFTRKLLEFAHSSDVNLIFKSIHEKSKEIEELAFQECAPNMFIVKSVHKSYTVNTEVGVCNCPAGMFGAFCKHLCYLLTANRLSLPCAPFISMEEKSVLANLAIPDDGESLPEDKKYLPDDGESLPEDDGCLPEDGESLPEQRESQNIQSIGFCDIQTDNINQNLELASNEDKNEIISELYRIQNMISESKLKKTEVKDIVNTLKKIKSADDFDRIIFLKTNFRTKKPNVPNIYISEVLPRVRLTSTKRKVPGENPPPKKINK